MRLSLKGVNLVSIELSNVRGLRRINWDITGRRKPGWHVIIGDNGSGKTSFLRAIALSLLGPDEFAALRQNPRDWLTHGEDSGTTRLNFDYDRHYDRFAGGGQPVKNYLLSVGVILQKMEGVVQIKKRSFRLKTDRHVWGDGAGWFSVGYGPFRRFTGGNKDNEKIFYSNPRLGRHLSVFGEDVALSEALEWLQSLRFKQLENRAEGDLLNSIFKFINQNDFLPHGVRLLEVDSEGVTFQDAYGAVIPVQGLSDGFRSLLSMTFELIRQLALAYGSHEVFNAEDKTIIQLPGIVLIDEVDAHLHPTWQRRIGLWFRKHFPQIQFIVSTHSPLVCQAASVGTVFKLPTPGTDESGTMLVGIDLDRLLYGNLLDAYSTGAFGDDVGRSDEGRMMLQRLAALNLKETQGSLTPTERKEQEKLRAQLPTTAAITSAT